MPTEPGTPPETTPETPPDGGNTGGTPPAPSKVDGKTAAEWKASYVGLQQANQRMKDGLETQVSDLTSKLETANAEIETLKSGGTSKDSQLTVLQTQVAKLTEQLETLQNEKKSTETELSRSKLVMADFPELAPWEAQGLLPQGGTEEETREALKKFRETLTGQVGAGVRQTMSGATPPGSGKTSPSTPPPDGSQENADYVWDQMAKYAGRDQAKFQEWQKKWDELQAKKAA